MRILLVHRDKSPWATYHRAVELKKRWTEDEVDIVNAHSLPIADKYDVVHFLYSGGITQSKYYIVANKNKVFLTLASERTLDCVYDKKHRLIKVFQNCRGIVCQNPKLVEKLLDFIGKRYKDKIHYIPNGVDEKLFNRKFVVGYVGSYLGNVDHKGFELAKQACDELGLELKTAHNGKLENARPYEEMPYFYREIDCLVIPSLSEGCNNPTLESLAMNKPVISTRVGIAEKLEGVILVDRNVESIKKALRKLSGRIQILEQFTWDLISLKYRQIYVEKQRT